MKKNSSAANDSDTELDAKTTKAPQPPGPLAPTATVAAGEADAAAPVGAETADHKIARLERENQALRQYHDSVEAEKAELAEREKIIEAKTRAGLTRAQAIAVIERQKAHDAELERQWASRRPQIIEILRKFPDLLDARKQISQLFPGIIIMEEIKAAQKAIRAESAEAAAS